MQRSVLAVIAGALVVIGVGVASVIWLGGGDDEDDAPPANAENTATPTLTAGDFGPAPRLGDWILDVYPIHASAIPQAETRTTNPNDPRGVCFEASFHDLPENARWFRMAVDGEEVTTQGIWIVESEVNPTGGTFCYDPPEGLEVGVHEAAVSVQNPSAPSQPTRQIVAWKFEVIP